MARPAGHPLPILRHHSLLHLILCLLFIACAAGADRRVSKHDGAASGEQIWCVAKNNAEDAVLQAALDWACGPGSADCQPIQVGGVCFEPEDIQSHASYAFNNYFLRHGSSPAACDFSGTAAITALNPSHGDCKFPASLYASNGGFSGSSSDLVPTSGGRCRNLALFAAIYAATATACAIFR